MNFFDIRNSLEKNYIILNKWGKFFDEEKMLESFIISNS